MKCKLFWRENSNETRGPMSMYACNLEAMCTTFMERTNTHAWVTYAQAWVHAETCAGLLMDMECFKW